MRGYGCTSSDQHSGTSGPKVVVLAHHLVGALKGNNVAEGSVERKIEKGPAPSGHGFIGKPTGVEEISLEEERVLITNAKRGEGEIGSRFSRGSTSTQCLGSTRQCAVSCGRTALGLVREAIEQSGQ